jgi:exopolysaccharide/PEP-CTERM locus tyrosine autokinase
MRSIEKGLEKAINEREGRRNHEAENLLKHWKGKVSDRSKLSSYLVSYLEPRSLAAEQFKRLRTKILRNLKEKTANTVLVTSAIKGEGKTNTVLNLAISIAQGMKETVLVVDTDFRKAGVHEHLGISADHGLVDYLRGEADLGDLLVKTEIPKLTLLPSGKAPNNPSDLLASDRMAEMLQEVRNRYENRYIVLDSSPVNVFADTAILAPLVDGVLLVVKDGATPRDFVLRAIGQLEQSNVLGICLNQISAPDSLMETYYYYYDKPGSDE